MRYLNQVWESRFEHDRLVLLDKVCVQMGDRQQLKQIRSQLFQSEQSYASFMLSATFFNRLSFVKSRMFSANAVAASRSTSM